jgi:hypothetical protein
MKRVAYGAMALIGLMASPLPACEPVASFALAVPLFVEDAYAGRAVQVLVAPVIEPLIVVPRPLIVPRPRVQVFTPRRGVRVFVR